MERWTSPKPGRVALVSGLCGAAIALCCLVAANRQGAAAVSAPAPATTSAMAPARSTGAAGPSLSAGAPAEEARTAAVAAIVLGEIFYLFNCRSLGGAPVGAFSNPWVWAGAAGMLALQALFTYAPVMNRLFHTAPLDAATWGWLALFGLALSVVVSLEKRGREAWRRRAAARAPRARMS